MKQSLFAEIPLPPGEGGRRPGEGIGIPISGAWRRYLAQDDTRSHLRRAKRSIECCVLILRLIGGQALAGSRAPAGVNV